MSEENKFDDFIKQQLSDYSPEVPPNIWENIEAENNKRRPIAFWWNLLNNRAAVITAIILLTAGIATFTWKIAVKKDIAAVKPAGQSTKKIIYPAEKIPADKSGQVATNNKNTVTAAKENKDASNINNDSNDVVNAISIKDKKIADNLKEKAGKKEKQIQFLKDGHHPVAGRVGELATVSKKPSGKKIKIDKLSNNVHSVKNDGQMAMAESKSSNKKIKAHPTKAYTVHINNGDVFDNEDSQENDKLIRN